MDGNKTPKTDNTIDKVKVIGKMKSEFLRHLIIVNIIEVRCHLASKAR